MPTAASPRPNCCAGDSTPRVARRPRAGLLLRVRRHRVPQHPGDAIRRTSRSDVVSPDRSANGSAIRRARSSGDRPDARDLAHPIDSCATELARRPAVLAPVRRHLSRARRHRRGGARVRRTAAARRTLCQRATASSRSANSASAPRSISRSSRNVISSARRSTRGCISSRSRSTRSRRVNSQRSRNGARERCRSTRSSRVATRRCWRVGIGVTSPPDASRCRCSSATLRPDSATSSADSVFRSTRGCSTGSRPTATRSCGATSLWRTLAAVVSGRHHDRDVQRRRRRSPRAGRGRIRDAKNRPTTAQASHARRCVRADARRRNTRPPRSVAVVGAGLAGAATARQLARSRHVPLRCSTPRRRRRTAWRPRCFIRDCCRMAVSARGCAAPDTCTRRTGTSACTARRGPAARCNFPGPNMPPARLELAADVFAPTGDWVIPVDPATASSLAGLPVRKHALFFPHARALDLGAFGDALICASTRSTIVQTRQCIGVSGDSAHAVVTTHDGRIGLRPRRIVRGRGRQRFRTGAVRRSAAGMGADRSDRPGAGAGDAAGRRRLHDLDWPALGRGRHVRTEAVGGSASDASSTSRASTRGGAS